MDEARAVAEWREALTCDAEGIGVAVEADHRELREPLEQGMGVAAHAERGIDEHRAVALDRRSEQLHRARQHDGGVNAFDVHDSALPSGPRIPIPIRSS